PANKYLFHALLRPPISPHPPINICFMPCCVHQFHHTRSFSFGQQRLVDDVILTKKGCKCRAFIFTQNTNTELLSSDQ
ncbi:MAG TPA: hypothetical protein VFD56_02690, partial [Chitinophagaceae bacterium]|nr:hypothetical protein [Chitinophagaceae bacterium]